MTTGKIHIIYKCDDYRGTFSPPATEHISFDLMQQAVEWLADKMKKGFPYFISPTNTYIFIGDDVSNEVFSLVETYRGPVSKHA